VGAVTVAAEAVTTDEAGATVTVTMGTTLGAMAGASWPATNAAIAARRDTGQECRKKKKDEAVHASQVEEEVETSLMVARVTVCEEIKPVTPVAKEEKATVQLTTEVDLNEDRC
jgi:hypothetical protein